MLARVIDRSPPVVVQELPDAITAKDVIFPEGDDPAEAARGEWVYERSHGTLPAGIQRKHGINWEATGIDPQQHAFGKKAQTAGAIK